MTITIIVLIIITIIIIIMLFHSLEGVGSSVSAAYGSGRNRYMLRLKKFVSLPDVFRTAETYRIALMDSLH